MTCPLTTACQNRRYHPRSHPLFKHRLLSIAPLPFRDLLRRNLHKLLQGDPAGLATAGCHQEGVSRRGRGARRDERARQPAAWLPRNPCCSATRPPPRAPVKDALGARVVLGPERQQLLIKQAGQQVHRHLAHQLLLLARHVPLRHAGACVRVRACAYVHVFVLIGACTAAPATHRELHCGVALVEGDKGLWPDSPRNAPQHAPARGAREPQQQRRGRARAQRGNHVPQPHHSMGCASGSCARSKASPQWGCSAAMRARRGSAGAHLASCCARLRACDGFAAAAGTGARRE